MQSIRLSILFCFFFFSSRRRHTRYWRDWSSDVCSSDLSITEHEGRIIQSRSEESIIQEVEDIRDKVKGFTGTISDLGGPTANMYRLGCKSPEIEAACRKPSCVSPGICQNLHTDHAPLVKI